MKNVIAVLLFLVANFCSAQLTFGEHIVSDNTILPEGVTYIELADLDGDGDLDMVTASEDDNKIAWFENTDGLGSFGKQNVISLKIEDIQYVRTADLDGDGDMDVIGVSQYANEIIGYFNNGNGEFVEETIISFEGEFGRIVNLLPRDMDMDGNVDLIVLMDTDEFVFFKNIDNQGNYARSIIAEVEPFSFDDIKIGDIDNDGDLDIVTRTDIDVRLTWYEFDNGVFENHDFYVEGIAEFFELGDLDNDGDLDIVIASNFGTNPYVSWLEFEGDFGNENIFLEEMSEILAIDVADLKSDGYGDVFINATGSREVLWAENVALTDPITVLPLSSTYISLTGVLLLGDINNDDFPDIVTGDLKWFLFEPDLDMYGVENKLESFTDGAYDVVSMDVDGDGDFDLISASNNDGRIGWFENLDSHGEFNKVQNLITDKVSDVTDISLSDIDGDGILDIVGTAWNQGLVFWIRNNGDATFSDLFIIDSSLQGANSIVIGDIDGDGDMDVVASGYGPYFDAQEDDKKIKLFKNLDGLGAFDEGVNLMMGERNTAVQLGDVDNDQDLDVFYTGGSQGVQWIENLNGDGIFGSPQKISSEFIYPLILELVDIDLDGDIDVLTSTSYLDRTIVYYNNGEGDFEEVIVADISCTSMKARDIDQDGDMDIIIGVFGENEPYYGLGYLEKMSGELEYVYHSIFMPYIVPPNSIEVEDLDGDGDLDIFTATIENDKIAWYENYDPVSVNDVASVAFSISPVPVASTLMIDSEVDLIKVVIYNAEGKLQLISSEVNQIDVSSLTSGLYIIQVEDVEGNLSAMKFVKE